MVKVNKKAHRPKDKYYHLAKEQGFRARSAFKLIQLNKKYDFLSNANVVLDLCAAPGGWLQVCAKYMPVSSLIVGVDLNPIRAIRNVITHQSDIMSTQCRQLLKQDMKGREADVVLHDGAPNVGADWRQDAYDQNVLTLHSLRLATEFLRKNGLFITKVFRSKDYHALLWVFNQLFTKVEATKPHSSRNASAEIFVVCRGYTAPAKIDSRMLDPLHVFKDNIPEADAANSESRMTVETLHQKLFEQRRHREGYDESKGILQIRHVSVADFIESEDPVRILADANALLFDARAAEAGYNDNPATSDEIKACCADLKVLGRKEFKFLLKWRLELRKKIKQEKQAALKAEKEATKLTEATPLTEEDSEAARMEELEDAITEEAAKSKREKKRAAKLRNKAARRAALGMDAQNVDLDAYDMGIGDPNSDGGAVHFSRIQDARTATVNLDELDEDELQAMREASGEFDDDDDHINGMQNLVSSEDEVESEEDEDDAYLGLLEDQMDNQYQDFVNRRNATAKRKGSETGLHTSGIKLSRRARLEAEAKMQLDKSEAKLDFERQEYLKLLASARKRHDDGDESNDSDSDTDSDEDSNQGFYGKKETEDASEDEDQGGLAAQARASRWFSQRMFNEVEAEESVNMLNALKERSNDVETDSNDKTRVQRHKRGRDDSDSDEDFDNDREESAGQDDDVSDENESDTDASLPDIMKDLPKSEREKRKERLKKNKERQARKEAKRAAKQQMESLNDVPLDIFEDSGSEEEGETTPMTPAEKKRKEREAKKRSLIEAGIGQHGTADENDTFEVVSQNITHNNESDASSVDPREEDYDSETHAEILALGKLMRKHTTAKALVDASYNRYAFDDSEIPLPSWFAADEAAHFRPQLPVSKAEVDKIRTKFRDIAARPIHKVAEARARKKKRAAVKLDKARRVAARVANDNDISQVSKAKAIERAYKQAKVKSAPTTFVVSRKGHQVGSVGGGKGKGRVKFVDARMRKDLRGEQRAAKNKKSKGKKGRVSVKRRRT